MAHFPQNAIPSGFSNPQLAQFILRFRDYLCSDKGIVRRVEWRGKTIARVNWRFAGLKKAFLNDVDRVDQTANPMPSIEPEVLQISSYP